MEMETENRYIETDLGNVAPNPRGDYSAETTYEYLDLVVYKGGSYLCVADTSQGTAPESGKTTAVWQVLTLPGDLTPEYVAIHDDVVNKAASAAENAANTATDRAAVADMKEDVEQLQGEVTESTASAKADKESAAGYAAAAEASRKAAAEAEANVVELVTGFDEHVASKTLDATEAIASAREKAVQVVDSATQAAKSAASSAANSASTATQAASTATSQATAALAASKTATSAASETVKTAKAAQEDIATAKSNAIKAVQDAAVEEKKAAAASAENAATSAESAKTFADNAAQSAKSVEDASKQIEQNKKDVASLKEDLGNKAPAIIKKASGKTIIINDSSNFPIKILSGTGKIIITGKNILDTEKKNEFIPFEAKAGTLFTLITNGELSAGGNVKFINENNEEVWFAIDKGRTKASAKIGKNVKGYVNLLSPKEGLKYCFSVGENNEYEEHVRQVITAPVDSEQLKAIHTNYPTTILTSENEISVEYVADTEAYIEKRIKEENQSLQKQILEIQNVLISQKISGV